MKPIPVYTVTEITMEEWRRAFAPQQKEHHYDHIYQSTVRQGPGSRERNGQIKLQIRTDRNKSNWLNVTVEQYRKIELIILGE